MNEEEKPRKFFSSVRKHVKRKETMRGHEDEDLNIEVTGQGSNTNPNIYIKH